MYYYSSSSLSLKILSLFFFLSSIQLHTFVPTWLMLTVIPSFFLPHLPSTSQGWTRLSLIQITVPESRESGRAEKLPGSASPVSQSLTTIAFSHSWPSTHSIRCHKLPPYSCRSSRFKLPIVLRLPNASSTLYLGRTVMLGRLAPYRLISLAHRSHSYRRQSLDTDYKQRRGDHIPAWWSEASAVYTGLRRLLRQLLDQCHSLRRCVLPG